ncbi:MAG TPA: hypothetical protein VIQ31_14610 [Phormidium sp.]
MITEIDRELDYKYFPEKSVPRLNFSRSPASCNQCDSGLIALQWESHQQLRGVPTYTRPQFL